MLFESPLPHEHAALFYVKKIIKSTYTNRKDLLMLFGISISNFYF
jgi:hypothetical protein